jgi:glycerol-3-phosphate cytidylyltransferase
VKVVFVSGVWDILHIGHVRMLQRARQLGDRLVVGIVTNGFAESYKERPVYSTAERMELVASLRCVDVVVPHRYVDDYEFIYKYGVSIRAIGPEFGQVKGQKECMDELEKQGVVFIVLERTPDVSTTLIKEKIREETDLDCDSD